MAILNHEEVENAIWRNMQSRYVKTAKFKCDLCWTEAELLDPRFATQVMEKAPECPKCPICGETMRCTSYEMEMRDLGV